jgi:CRP/FNR family transcriptional regulator
MERKEEFVFNFLRKLPYFSSLDENKVRELASLFKERSFGKKEIIFREGDPPSCLYILKEGKIKIYKVSQEGKVTTLEVIPPGRTFGEVAIFDGKPYPATAEAATEVKVLCLLRNYFLDFLQKNPAVAISIISDLGARLRLAKTLMQMLAAEPAEKRLALTILKLAEKLGKPLSNGVLVDIPLTRQDLADMSGLAQETVVRIIGRWQKEGVLSFKRKHILIRDKDSLNSLTQL